MTPNLHLWLIPVLPLIGAAINGLFGKRFSRQTVVTVALVFSGAAFAMALWIASRFSSLGDSSHRDCWPPGFAPETFRPISLSISTSFRW